jgi:hypothetical protein
MLALVNDCFPLNENLSDGGSLNRKQQLFQKSAGLASSYTGIVQIDRHEISRASDRKLSNR